MLGGVSALRLHHNHGLLPGRLLRGDGELEVRPQARDLETCARPSAIRGTPMREPGAAGSASSPAGAPRSKA